MVRLGYKLMSEEHGPRALLDNAVRAERAGFDFAAISDHFSPWLDEEGHSPFAWSVLGAAAQATSRLGLMTAVTCPIMRYHPAVVAQAAATVALLSDDRFLLGLGSGERLNEHVVGIGWPGIHERQERLSEAVDIIRGLLTGELTRHEGKYFKLDHARLFDRPEKAPQLVIAAGGTHAAKLAAEKGAALIVTEPDAELVDAYRSAGGAGPHYAEVGLCYAESEERARETAHHYYRWALSGGMAELPYTDKFAAVSRHVTPELVARQVSCGPTVERHLEAINRYVAAGYDHLILLQIGPAQDEFFDFFERQLAPRLRKQDGL